MSLFADPEVAYILDLEAHLETSASQATEAEQFSQIINIGIGGIEVDSVRSGVYRVWGGVRFLGSFRSRPGGWKIVSCFGSPSTTFFVSSEEAIAAIAHAALPY